VSLTWSNVAVALAWSVAAALAAWLLTWPVRRRSFGWLLVSVTLTGTAASAGALLGAVHSMLLPTGDELPLVLLTVAAGLLAVTGAAAATRRIAREHRAVGEAVARMGLGEIPTDPPAQLSRDVQLLQRQVQHTAAALNVARERERALEDARRELVAWVSHDLRTPLAGLRAMAEALEDGVASEPEAYYKQIGASVQRLSAMVDDLFDLSRLQAGAVRRGTEPVELTALVAGCLDALEPLASARGVQLVPHVHDALVTRGDPAQLDRALTNVVANAIRYSPQGGRVDVHVARSADGAAEIAVNDQCGGIPDDVLPRVFDVGYRGNSARTADDAAGGAGLGLAITRGVVEAHHGTVGAGNRGAGCRFWLRLPPA
jgi:signal transduction histidine kinase